MHIFSRLRTWLSIVMSHKCIEVVVALGTIFDEKKVGNMWLGSYSWAAAANMHLPLTGWRKWDWPYSILERLLAAWRCCVWRLGQLEMLFWSTCSIWINTMWAKIQDPRFLKCRQGPWAFLHHLQRFNFHAEHIFKCATTFNSASTKQVVKYLCYSRSTISPFLLLKLFVNSCFPMFRSSCTEETWWSCAK